MIGGEPSTAACLAAPIGSIGLRLGYNKGQLKQTTDENMDTNLGVDGDHFFSV